MRFILLAVYNLHRRYLLRSNFFCAWIRHGAYLHSKMSDTIISRWHPQDRTRTHTTTEYKVENFLALDFLDFLDFLVFIFSSFDWKSSAHLVFTTDRLADFVLTRRRQLQQLESIVNQEIPLLTIFSCFVFILNFFYYLFSYFYFYYYLFSFLFSYQLAATNKPSSIIYHEYELPSTRKSRSSQSFGCLSSPSASSSSSVHFYVFDIGHLVTAILAGILFR